MYRVCRQHLPRNVALLVIASPSLTNGLMTGQVSAALAAAVLWAVAHKDRLTAGIIIGLVATVKPQLVALAPLYFIIQSDWRAFFGAAMSFVAVLCSTLMLFGPAIWMDWAASLPHFREVLNDKFITGAMVTPAGFAEWHQLPTWPFLVIGGLIGVLLVFVCRNSEPVKATAAVTAGSLLASPYALTYDLAAIMPFMAYLVYRGSIPAAVAISAALNPMPLLVAAYCLAKGPK